MKILIADKDKYFTAGLRALLADYFKEKGISTEFNESINPNVRYSMAFVCEERMAQHRSVKTAINADTVFIIRAGSEEMEADGDEGLKSIQRHDCTETIINQIDAAYSPLEIQRSMGSKTVLTKREKTVLSYYSIGYSNVQIGQLLGINQKTVSAHKVNAMTKFNFKHKGDFRRWLIANVNCEE